MSAHCKVCGDQVREPTEHALEGLGCKSGLPQWLSELCLTCLYDLARYVPDDEEGYPLREVNEGELNNFLADRVMFMAQRIAAGRSPERCEVITGGYCIGDPEDLRCARFASGTWDGRLVCGPHHVALKRGRDVGFIGTDWRRVRPYLIWARNADELLARAHEIAGDLREKAA